MGDRLDKKTKAAIEEIVERKLMEILGDPDYGLELRKEVEERLKQSLKGEGKGMPAATVAKKLGLKW